MFKLQSTNRQQGFSLLEILITLIILSIGLLGLAALQSVSLKNVNNSQFRTVAIHYAYDIAERMRSNRTGVTQNGYAAIKGNETAPGCSTCSTSQLAQLDAFEWNQMIKRSPTDGGLPSGNGTVTENGNVHDIVVSWDEQTRNAEGGDVATQSITVSIRI